MWYASLGGVGGVGRDWVWAGPWAQASTDQRRGTDG
jgi:hypothetical protein